jgi:2-C-methyl-D-erythritol 4-phosphate cytidylyltransferase
MKTVAIVLAGGKGTRMGGDKPKQFLSVYRKPIIIYTLENFQKHKKIDDILVVCLESWIADLKKMVEKYHLSKVKWLIPGGLTGHDSARNAIFFLKDKLRPDDMVIIHDAARPLLPSPIIDDLLAKGTQFGNACASLPCYETLATTSNQQFGNGQVDRSTIRRIQTPQAYRYGFILPYYERAERENKHDFVYANTLVLSYGGTIYFSEGFDNNLKITTKEDLPLFKALLKIPAKDLLK